MIIAFDYQVLSSTLNFFRNNFRSNIVFCMQTAIGRKQYAIIGKILCKTQPQLATELLDTVAPGEENDLKRIFFFYSRFADHQPAGVARSNARKIFVAAMLKLFYPYVYNGPIVKMQHGFNRNIAACFGTRNNTISEDIREVIVTYKIYEDFRQAVDQLTDAFKNES